MTDQQTIALMAAQIITVKLARCAEMGLAISSAQAELIRNDAADEAIKLFKQVRQAGTWNAGVYCG